MCEQNRSDHTNLMTRNDGKMRGVVKVSQIFRRRHGWAFKLCLLAALIANGGLAVGTPQYPVGKVAELGGNDNRISIAGGGSYLFKIRLNGLTIYNKETGTYAVNNHRVLWKFNDDCAAGKNSPIFIEKSYFAASCNNGTTSYQYKFYDIRTGRRLADIPGLPILKDDKYIYYIDFTTGNWPIRIRAMNKHRLYEDKEVFKIYPRGIPTSCVTRDDGGYEDRIGYFGLRGSLLIFGIKTSECYYRISINLKGEASNMISRTNN